MSLWVISKPPLSATSDILRITKRVGDRVGGGGECVNLTVVCLKLGDFKTEIEYILDHLNISKRMGNRAGVGGVYCNLSLAYCSLGDFEKSIA